MDITLTGLEAGLLAVGVIGFVATIISLQSRPEDGALSFAGVTGSFTFWSFGAGLHYASTSLFWQELWLVVYLIAGPMGCLAWLVFSLSYTGQQDRITPARLLGLAGIALAHVGIVLTNRVHELVYAPYEAGMTGAALHDWGPYFYSYHLFFLGLVGLGSVILFAQSRRTRNIYRQINLMLGVGGLTVIIADLADVFNLTPLPYMVDPVVTYAFWSVVAIVSFYSVRLYSLLPADMLFSIFEDDATGLVPMGRDFVIEDLEDGFLILDADGRVVDINATVKATLGRGVVGSKLADIDAMADLVEDFDEEDAPTDLDGVMFREGSNIYQLTVSAIEDRSGATVGHVLVWQDVTDAKRREQELREREEELELLKDTMSRFLRHNIRNDLNVVQGYADILQERHPEHEEELEKIMDISDKVMERSQKARTLERVLDDPETIRTDVSEYVDLVVSEMRAAHPDVTFDVDVPEDMWVSVTPHFTTALENLLENAIEHNDDDAPRVSVSADVKEEVVELRVADNGPGIDEHEINVIDQERETSLQHGSGFGLWVVSCVVTKSEGDLEVKSGDGTTVIVRLQRASPPEPPAGEVESEIPGD